MLVLREGFPMNVLNTLKHVSEVCSIFCATDNPVEPVAAETELGRGILGVVEGAPQVRVVISTMRRTRKHAAAEDRLQTLRIQHPTGPSNNHAAPPRMDESRQCACQAAAGTFSLAGLLRSVARPTARRTSR
jgi:hypothetical protein